jgi:trigger factor
VEYKIEETSPVTRKVNVTVPVDEVNAAVLTTLALYRKTADIKGFRKGKAPSGLIESRFKNQIYAEATTDLVNYQLNEILSGEKITPLSRISVDSKEMVPGPGVRLFLHLRVVPPRSSCPAIWAWPRRWTSPRWRTPRSTPWWTGCATAWPN